jgi:hypothetical protein
MIRPVNFTFNAETAVNNAFQVAGKTDDAQVKAEQEFDGFVEKLRHYGIQVTVINDTPIPYTPDSIFPNNWISFHEDGTVVLYPMFAVNRRSERKQHVMQEIFDKFFHSSIIDMSGAEANDHFLEGTGSLVLDRDKRIAYACLSPRTDQALVDEFCRKMDYKGITFFASDKTGNAIYHTNVMMCVADRYVVVCLDSIPDAKQSQSVVDAILSTGKKVIPITLEQMNRFAGNMLQVNNNVGDKFLVMSTQAYESLDEKQRSELESFNPIIHSDLTTIETNGGGSARCMMAEVFLPEKSTH